MKEASHIAAVITRLLSFVEHTAACPVDACVCGAAPAAEDAEEIVKSLLADAPLLCGWKCNRCGEEHTVAIPQLPISANAPALSEQPKETP